MGEDDWRAIQATLFLESVPKRLASSRLEKKAQALLAILAEGPFATPQRYEELVGDLAGCYSRQHRLLCEVPPDERVVHVLRMWTHYE